MKKIVYSAVAFALLTGTAFAASESAAVRVFKSMDRDNNGKVTQAEYSGYWEKFFQQSDKNGDGVLDFNEFPDALAFHLGDKNKDQKIDPDEHHAFRAGQFKQLDKNKDGKLTLKEIAK